MRSKAITVRIYVRSELVYLLVSYYEEKMISLINKESRYTNTTLSSPWNDKMHCETWFHFSFEQTNTQRSTHNE